MHEGWYAIKKRNQTQTRSRLKNSYDKVISAVDDFFYQ